MRTASVVFVLVSALASIPSSARAADAETAALKQGIVWLSAAYLVETHQSLGVLVDAYPKNIYKPEVAEELAGGIITRIRNTDLQFKTLLEKGGLDATERKQIAALREVCAAEARSAEAIRAHWASREAEDYERYTAARKVAWAGLLKFTAGDVPGNAAPPAGDAVEAVRAGVCEVLAKFDPDTADKLAARKALRRDLLAVVEKYPALRPETGAKTYTSKEKSFVLVVAAHGVAGEKPGMVEAEDHNARFVVVVAGDGSPAGEGTLAGSGWEAVARAPAGVAVALGGRGGEGGGGGASGAAKGGVGSVGLGGEGGKGLGGNGAGGSATGNGIKNAEAVGDAAKAAIKK